jgi:DNA-binding transcriptional MerR regulator
MSKLSGIPTATLNHWVVTRLITPSVRGPAGKRATRYWSITDLIQVKAVRALRNAGCPLQKLRKLRKLLDSCNEDFANQKLIWDGNDILVITETGRLESALNRPGQGILSAKPLSNKSASKQNDQSGYDIKLLLSLSSMHALATRHLKLHSDYVDTAHLEKLRRTRVRKNRAEMRPIENLARSSNL